MKLKGTPQVLNRLKRVSRETDLAVKSAVVRNTDQIFAEAFSDVPVKLGNLKRSGIRTFPNNQLTGIVAFGGSPAPYAPYVEFGTGSKVSIPQGFSDYAMEFYVNGNGRSKPKPFLIPAYLKYKKVFLQDLKKIAKNISK